MMGDTTHRFSSSLLRIWSCFIGGKDFCYDPDDDKDDGGDDDVPGSDTINDLGQEYCDTHTCKNCQGDCDDSSQCEGSLRCFQRSANEPVPGCKGGDGSDTRKCFHSLHDQMTLQGGSSYSEMTHVVSITFFSSDVA